MVVIGSKILAALLMAVLAVVFLAGGAVAADPPAPSPTSAAGAVVPSLSVAIIASSIAFLLEYFLH